jgi:hypothetical protein
MLQSSEAEKQDERMDFIEKVGNTLGNLVFSVVFSQKKNSCFLLDVGF